MSQADEQSRLMTIPDAQVVPEKSKFEKFLKSVGENPKLDLGILLLLGIPIAIAIGLYKNFVEDKASVNFEDGSGARAAAVFDTEAKASGTIVPRGIEVRTLSNGATVWCSNKRTRSPKYIADKMLKLGARSEPPREMIIVRGGEVDMSHPTSLSPSYFLPKWFTRVDDACMYATENLPLDH